MAMIKDVYDSRNREMILAWVSSMVLISPMAAPVLGALLLGFTSWRGVFVVLGVIGLIALAGSLALVETLKTRYTGTLGQSIGRLAVVAKNPGFLSLLIIFSLLSFSSMAFIASSCCIRTPGTNLMLEQQEYDTGSASALMSCFGILMGSLGMTVISQEWSNTIQVLGSMNILVGLLCLGLWLLLSRRPFVKQIP